MAKKTQKDRDREIDAEYEGKTKEEILAEFDESKALHVPAKKRENILISIRLPIRMIQQLREVAIKKGDIGYQQIIKIFIADGLSNYQRIPSTSVKNLPAQRMRTGIYDGCEFF